MSRKLPLLYTPLMDLLSIIGQVNKDVDLGYTPENRALRVLATPGVVEMVQSGLISIASRKESATAKHYEAISSANAVAEKEMQTLISDVEKFISARKALNPENGNEGRE